MAVIQLLSIFRRRPATLEEEEETVLVMHWTAGKKHEHALIDPLDFSLVGWSDSLISPCSLVSLTDEGQRAK